MGRMTYGASATPSCRIDINLMGEQEATRTHKGNGSASETLPMTQSRNERFLMFNYGQNIKVTCPHCRRETWVRDGHNDPCEHCGRIIQTR